MKRFIGDRKFYIMVLSVALPIMLQNGITNFVSMLDNIMVGRLGTESMSGVSIVNQFLFIFQLMIFGAISGAGIFTAQYHGKKDNNGIRYTFRLKLIIAVLATAAFILVFSTASEQLISLFLHESESGGNLELTMQEGKNYLAIMLIGLIPYAVSQVYASTLREIKQTVMPLIASSCAVLVNFILNCILIFGNFGAPRLGVVGAAIATTTSRFVELGILLAWTHSHTERYEFIKGAYRSMMIPKNLTKRMVSKGIPLLINEFFWAAAITAINQCYSTRGLDVVAALTISTTISNVFNTVFMSLGNAISIIVGNLLGAAKFEEAMDADTKMIAFSVMSAILIGIILIAFSGVFPLFYNTADSVRSLAQYFIIVIALVMPFQAFANAAYFTLRSGGNVLITFILDSGFMLAISIPVTAILAYATTLPIYWLFPLCQGLEIIKVFFGAYLIKKGTWQRQLVGED